MSGPDRSTPGGRAYRDLQNRARRERRGTQELLTLYVLERWLARLSGSPYVDRFVLKGGVLLAALDARRATADVDLLARNLPNREADVLSRVIEIARRPDRGGGVAYDVDSISARAIREQDNYPGLRVSMDCSVASAEVKLRLDVNFGDPVTPAPRRIALPALRPGSDPIVILGYPIETVLAEKLATAITLGSANTRVRDYTDIFTLIRRHMVDGPLMRRALTSTCSFRGVAVAALGSRTSELIALRAGTYRTHRTRLGPDGGELPTEFADVVRLVTDFADPLASDGDLGSWRPDRLAWC